jgi:hypothetical protein
MDVDTDSRPDLGIEKKNVIAVLGVPRSGKIEALGYLMAAYDLPKVSFKSVLDDALLESGLPIGYVSQETMKAELRKRHGDDYFVRKVIERIDAVTESEDVLLEGLETSSDYRALRARYGGNLHTITVHLPITNIVREFIHDAMEVVRLEAGGPITITEHLVMNEGDLGKMTQALDTIMMMHGIFKKRQ